MIAELFLLLEFTVKFSTRDAEQQY